MYCCKAMITSPHTGTGAFWRGLVLPLWVWAAAAAVFAKLCFWCDAAGSCYSSAPLTVICRHPVEVRGKRVKGGQGRRNTHRVECVAKMWLMPRLLNKYPECREQFRVTGCCSQWINQQSASDVTLLSSWTLKRITRVSLFGSFFIFIFRFIYLLPFSTRAWQAPPSVVDAVG